MALKPDQIGSKYRGNKRTMLTHEEGVFADDLENIIDAQLEIVDKSQRDFAVKLPERDQTPIPDQVLIALEQRYQAVGWTAKAGRHGNGFSIKLTPPPQAVTATA